MKIGLCIKPASLLEFLDYTIVYTINPDEWPEDASVW